MSVAALAVLAAGAVVLVGVIAIAVLVSRRPRDGVDTFRRQIDALSPEARRGVVDQVQSVAVRPEKISDRSDDSSEDDEPASEDDEATGDEPDDVQPDDVQSDDEQPDDGSTQRGA